VVHVAPRPLLARLERADQRMAAASSVGARVAVGRVVATADLAALETDSQMQPRVSRGQAILAARDGFRELGDVNVIEMGAGAHLIRPFPRPGGSASLWCINRTAVEPSPTAEA